MFRLLRDRLEFSAAPSTPIHFVAALGLVVYCHERRVKLKLYIPLLVARRAGRTLAFEQPFQPCPHYISDLLTHMQVVSLLIVYRNTIYKQPSAGADNLN
jgi:hypothetical protein